MIVPMGDKRCVVTGGSRGIGRAISARLAETGADVTLIARESRDLHEAAHAMSATALPCDFTKLDDVRSAAARLSHKPVDVLVLNAAMIAPRRIITVDGLEMTFAVNHLAPYLLTRLLMPRLSEGARIVIMGADPVLLARTPVDLEDLQSQRRFSPAVSYMRSKNMNVMFAYALARRLGGRRILVNAAHPGVINTGLADKTTGLLRLLTKLASPFVPRASVGADTPVWLATSADIRSGGDFYKKRKRVSTARHTTDPARQEALWGASAQIAGVTR
jgi:NAD(P)-dependent dehydrogenase (short-subunit alcohol dehydrogenase family)